MQIQKLEARSIKKHSVIVIIGKRNTGKSVLLCDILMHMSRRLDYGVAFTPTETSALMFQKFMPRSCIYDTFDPEVITRMIEFQRADADSKHIRSLYCVMDDCTYDKSILRSKVIRQLFMNGRHHHITVFLCAQYMMDLGPDLRGNVDYLFCLRDNAMGSRMKLWRAYFAVYPKYLEFSKVMDGATENYSSIVMDNTQPTNSATSSVFWYRAAPALRPFYIGRRSFHRLDLQHRVRQQRRRPVTGNVTLVGEETKRTARR